MSLTQAKSIPWLTLPLLFFNKNENEYAEAVDVFDSNEQLIDDIYTEAGI